MYLIIMATGGSLLAKIKPSKNRYSSEFSSRVSVKIESTQKTFLATLFTVKTPLQPCFFTIFSTTRLKQ